MTKDTKYQILKKKNPCKLLEYRDFKLNNVRCIIIS